MKSQRTMPHSSARIRAHWIGIMLLVTVSLPAQQRERIAAIVSYSAFQTAVVASAFVPSDLTVPTIMAGSVAQSIPLWTLRTGEGALYTSIVAGSFGGYFLAPEGSILGDSLGDAGIKTGLWSGYRTYGAYRQALDPEWESVPFVQLITAPVNPRHMNSAAFWTVLGAGAVVNVAFNLLSAEDGEAIWDTETSFLGGQEVAPVLGVSAAIAIGLLNNSLTGATEEALYRGVQYEALQNRFGRGAARWIDSLVFAGIHVPGDLYRGEDIVSAALSFTYRSLLSLGLQWVYDSAGLAPAAAAHAWLNVTSELAEFLVSAGVPTNN